MELTRYLLLLSHGTSMWDNSLWSFAIGVYLVILFPESLALTAIYGLILAASILIFGSTIGFWIDHTPRLQAARIALLVQNCSVAVCAVILCILLTYSDQWEAEGNQTLILIAQIGVVLIADVASLASEAQRIILERDWIVIISGGDLEELASNKFSHKKKKISLLSPVVAAVSLAVWNVISLTVEFLLLGYIFKKVPELERSRSNSTFPNNDTTDTGEESSAKRENWLVQAVKAWKLYFIHPVFPAGFGLALLYMTVLGFDNVTTGYLYSQGVPEWLLGVTTGAGSIFGVIGAIVYPFIRSRCGLPVTAIIGFATLNILTSGAIVASFLPGSPFEVYTGSQEVAEVLPVENNPSIITFIACLVVGRADDITGLMYECFPGLWVADLAVTQSMQETIKPELRGEINGVQSSMNYLMEVIKFGLVTALPKPGSFGYLITASECFTVLG
ncbi:unnamed protein product [Notodromas monacha]|uniref:Solute carrier family 40 member n=1 Tax=Notodromas monacha TaxID=399045 RepID=A0A7R9BV24_9CRUS|nr:unnamed protein product [Notodromas monacha]CAG0920923.1 unnamed protein product [Notodromas monacha]